MSAEIIAFPRRKRAWRITETKPGLYRDDLFESGRGVIFSTAAAKYSRVHRFMRRARNGWPVWLKGLDQREVRL